MGADRQRRIDELRHYSRLIERQAGHAVRPFREDGYVNLLNKYGTSRDTTEHYQYAREPVVPDDYLASFYEGNGMFAKVIDAPADECVKKGFELDGIKDEKIIRFYKDALGELEWEENISTAIKWARLFGGSIAVMLINDGRGLDEPLDWDNIHSIDDIRVYDRSLIQPDYQSMFSYEANDPFRTRGSRLGLPEYYDVFSKYGNFRVHDSRCLVFQNGVLPENTSSTEYQMWGMPEYVRIQRAIRDAEVAHGSAVKLLDRSIQAVYSMKDLAAELATEEGEDRVLKRMQLIDMARGLLNSIVIDSEGESYDFRQFSYSGVSQVIDTTCNYLSAVTNIPQTILFGRSPAGMNSTGYGDLENWYNYVERIQKRMLKKNLRYLLSVLFQAGLYTGEVDEVPEINIKFNPLWSLTEQEEVSLEQQKVMIQQARAQTAQMYVDMQVIDPSEVRKKLAAAEEFDVESMLDEYTPEELEENAPKGEDPMAAMMGGMGGMPPEGAPGGEMPPEEPPAETPQESAVGVSEAEGNTEPSGNAPVAAPDATRLPEDMKEDEDEENTEETDKDRFGGVGVIVVDNGRILCGRRRDGTGSLCGPGGHIEEGETAEEAAIRETEEEFGITPWEIEFLGTGAHEKNGYRPAVFLCTSYGGVPRCNDQEMASPRFLDLETLSKLKSDMFPAFRSSLYLLADVLGFDFNEKPDKPFRTENHNEPEYHDEKVIPDNMLKASFESIGARRADDENWITINGTHVQVDKNSGQVTKGPSALKGKGDSVSGLMNKAYESKAYKNASEKRDAAAQKYKDLDDRLKDIPSKLPKEQWSEEDKEFVAIMGKAYIPTNPEWTKAYEEKQAAFKELEKASKKADSILLRAEPKPHLSDFDRPKDTKDAQFEGFETSDTGTGLSTEGSRLVEMSPKEYLERCAAMFNDVDGRSTNLTMQIRQLDRKTIDELKEKMTSGTKMSTPWLDERGVNGQEGRHRAAAAYELGLEKIPVVYWDRLSTDRADDEGWKTINGTHVEIDKATGEMTKGPQALKDVNQKRIREKSESASKGTGSSSWKSKVQSQREEHKAMRDSKKAGLLAKLYGVQHGDIRYDQIVEAFQAEDGSLDKMIDAYYDILEKNGDPEPTKETAGQRENFSKMVSDEYGGDWTKARFGEMKKDTGFTGEEAERIFDSLSTWVGNQWSRANKDDLDAFVNAAPAYEGHIFRGMHFEQDGSFDEFMKKVAVGGDMTMNGPASWSSDNFVARTYAHMGDGTYDSVMVRCIKNRTGAPIGYINRMGEQEVLSGSKTRWTVLDTVVYEHGGGKKAVITVIEKGE